MLLRPTPSTPKPSPFSVTRTGGPRARLGLSLIEVIISLAIFLMSLAAIGQMIGFASDRGLDVQQRSMALQIAQSKLAEVQAGAIPLQGNSDQPYEEDDAYTWSVNAGQGSVANLWNVTVRVVRERKGRAKIEVVLSQMMLDPQIAGSTQDYPTAVQSSTTTASSSSSGTSSSGTSSMGSTGGTSSGSSPAMGSSSSGGAAKSSGGSRSN